MKIITAFLENSVNKNPNKIALVTTEQRHTYKELFELVKGFSSYISKFPKNSVVSLLFENSTEFVISYLGTLYASCIAHILPTNISDENLVKQIDLSEPRTIVTTKQFIKKIQKLTDTNIEKFDFTDVPINYNKSSTRKPEPNSISYLLYTSGTTTFPKGVPVSHQNCVFTTKNITDVLDYKEIDINILPLPLYHSFGLGCLHASLYTGATLFLHKNATNISEICDSIKNNSGSTLALVPATLAKILQESKEEILDSLSTLRLIITNTASLQSELVKKYRKILKNGHFATYYGLTEASRSTFMIFDKEGKEKSIGLPAPGVELKLIDAKNNIGNSGEIWIKGDNVIKKYWKNTEADKNIVNGWLKTGDLGFRDSEGYLYLTGRLDNIINVSGEKVMPEEIENVVKILTGIEEAVAVAMGHKIYGNVVKLFVKKSTNSQITKSEIISHCIKNLERHKVPTMIEFINEFPRTEYGKIKRFMLQ